MFQIEFDRLVAIISNSANQKPDIKIPLNHKGLTISHGQSADLKYERFELAGPLQSFQFLVEKDESGKLIFDPKEIAETILVTYLEASVNELFNYGVSNTVLINDSVIALKNLLMPKHCLKVEDIQWQPMVAR